jgi:hypothetical protein
MRDPHNPSHPVCHPARRHAPVIILALTALGPDGERLSTLYDAYLGTRVLVARTRQPFLNGARALLALGSGATTAVVLTHIGSDGNEGARQKGRFALPAMSNEYIDACCREVGRVQ